MDQSPPQAGIAATPVPPAGNARLHVTAIGLGAGLLNGLLGIGGGIFIVPGMIFLRGVTPRMAVSTSLGAVLVLSVVSFAVHLAITGFAFSVEGALVLLLAGAAGSQAGAWILKRLNQRWILFLFAGLTLFSAGNLAVKALFFLDPATSGAAVPPWWSYPLLGAVAGLFSGMLGIGGGGIAVLGFAILFRTPIQQGLPLALAINIANAGSGVIAQWRSGQILWTEVLRLVPAAMAGISIGILLAVALPANFLRLIFAAFFIYMGVRLLRRGLAG